MLTSRFFFLFCFYGLLLSVKAQNIKEHNFLGTLMLENKQIISFSLDLKEKDGSVNGFSLTNIGTTDETKSEITGLYFKKDKSFQLAESQIISTKSESDINSFCFINMNLRLKGILNKRLEGEFTGYFLNGDECAKGTVLLLPKEKLEKKVKKMKKKIEKKQNKEIGEFLTTTQLKDGDRFSINWESKYLIFFIWDSNEEDGDQIKLTINNKVILEKFKTKKKRQKIKYKLKKGINTIEITALNLGSSPPNTSKIEIVDKNIKYPIITQLTLDKKVVIELVRKK